jgi:hypothetical protein
METAICRVVVFSLAISAHREAFHRGVLPVVRKPFDDRKARAAVGAIGKGIAISAIGIIENFAQTIGARSDVGKDERSFGHNQQAQAMRIRGFEWNFAAAFRLGDSAGISQ